MVLPQILQASWLLQSAALILGCVAEVLNYPKTLSLLQRYATKSGPPASYGLGFEATMGRKTPSLVVPHDSSRLSFGLFALLKDCLIAANEHLPWCILSATLCLRAPFGCRDTAFALLRLKSGGLRGFGMLSQVTGLLGHPHPREAGLLSTTPGDFVFPKDCRAALCLIGQVAAPLQALWVTAHLQIAADDFFKGHSDFSPLHELAAFQEDLLISEG